MTGDKRSFINHKIHVSNQAGNFNFPPFPIVKAIQRTAFYLIENCKHNVCIGKCVLITVNKREEF